MIRKSSALSVLVSLAATLSVGTLIWLGYRSTANWKDTAAVAARHSTEIAVDLLFRALTQDMRAVQSNVLSSLARASDGARQTVSHQIASAFARYPYPEVFFVKNPAREEILFYGRSDRLPTWFESRAPEETFPVTESQVPKVGRKILERLNEAVETSDQICVFDFALSGDRHYQVIGLITYDDAFREQPKTIVGFMVDLGWIRDNYIPNLVAQVARTPSVTRDVEFGILDDHNSPITGADGESTFPTSRRAFPLLFMAPTLVAKGSLPASAQTWTVVAIASEYSALRAAESASRQALAVSIAAAFMLVIAFAASIRAVRLRTQLIEMRSDFISAVTHELKTPVAGIRASLDMLASDRVSTAEMAKEYARMAVGEVRRLGRLVDNLLAYARVTDVTEIYVREPVDMREVAIECLHHYWPQLAEGKFEQHVEIPPELPRVSADKTAISLALSNLMDNAIRYSSEVHDLTIRMSVDDSKRVLLIEVIDKGVGMDEASIPDLTSQAFRGAHIRPGGAGLGLGIAHRIVADHGGWMKVRSARGVGTTVTIALPIV